MRRTIFLAWLAAVFLSLAWTAPSWAQPKFGERPLSQRDRYIHFPIDPDYEAKLKQRLAMENELEPFKDLVRKMLTDPKMLILGKDQLNEMKLDDPKFKQAIKDWMDSDPKLRQSLVDWIKQNQPEKQPEDVAKLQEDLKQFIGDATKEAPPPPVSGKPIEPIRSNEDPLSNLTERAMKQAENSQFADWLRESPAWKRAFDDLRGSLKSRDEVEALADWKSKLFAPDGVAWKFAEGTLENLRNAPRPRIDRLGRDITVPGLGRLPIPDLGPPGGVDMNTPSWTSIGTAATWILAVLILLLVLGRLVRWPKRKTIAPSERPALGPWPVRPELVATRAELVQAFDYLALWTLGLRVQSWNHHAVASLWRDQAPACADPALDLARMYEKARYTNSAELLPDSERDRARQSLLQLAEAL
jgi:hypothetical protein